MTPYERLVSRSDEPATLDGCWLGRDRCCRWGYNRVTFYVPGLRKNVTFQAHTALWVALHASAHTADELFLAYLELRESGLEIDHRCVEPACRNPEHLDPVTKSENARRREARRRLLDVEPSTEF